MVSLVPQTKQNGCLYFAQDYTRQIGSSDVVRSVGEHVLLRFSETGSNRGNLDPLVTHHLPEEAVETDVTDIVLFDSFVPHRSELNKTDRDRPALFFTFNPAREGDWYRAYYQQKFAEIKESTS